MLSSLKMRRAVKKRGTLFPAPPEFNREVRGEKPGGNQSLGGSLANARVSAPPGSQLTKQEPCQIIGCIVWKVEFSRLENAEGGGMPGRRAGDRGADCRLWYSRQHFMVSDFFIILEVHQYS